jgi:hypothetical protein
MRLVAFNLCFWVQQENVDQPVLSCSPPRGLSRNRFSALPGYCSCAVYMTTQRKKDLFDFIALKVQKFKLRSKRKIANKQKDIIFNFHWEKLHVVSSLKSQDSDACSLIQVRHPLERLISTWRLVSSLVVVGIESTDKSIPISNDDNNVSN